MPTGRPRKPIQAKILDGSYREDRDGPIPPATGSPPESPAGLHGEALAFWGRVVPDLIERGVVAGSDTTALVLMCEWWALYRRLRDSLPPEGSLAGQTQTITQMAIATDKFDRLASRFGLNPSDRARLRLPPPGAAKTGKARFFKD